MESQQLSHYSHISHRYILTTPNFEEEHIFLRSEHDITIELGGENHR